jgi:2'-hydroxyisoflavone reductase
MRVLVLGGTQFVGRHIVEALLARGHEPTLFHRGRTGQGLFPESEHVLGDRMEDLGRLGEQDWDAVVDTSAYVPRAVRIAADHLLGRAHRLLFISTVSVYSVEGVGPIDEDSPKESLADPATETVDRETYGGLKVLCEEVAREAWGDRTTVVRPGIVAGPHDPTDRATYWVDRVARGGAIAVPERSDQPLQLIDGRDLAAFTVSLLEEDRGGVYNAVAPDPAMTLTEFFEACRVAAEVSHPEWVPIPVDDLMSVESGGRKGVPLVLPVDGSLDPLMRTLARRAHDAGLRTRPIAETLRATLEWHRSRPQPVEWRAGLESDAERSLIGSRGR